MAVVHAIGMPENESERKAIEFMVKHLPDDRYVIFHNLELPAPSGLPYEYDMIIVGEYAVYVVEVKGYRGRIRGNALEWELESGAITSSPLPLLNKKAKVVASRLIRHSPLLQSVWVQPLIFLTDDRVQANLDDEQASRVLHLDEAIDYILDPYRLPVSPKSVRHLTDRICDAIFKQFRPLHRTKEVGDYLVLSTVGKNNLYTTLLAEHRLLSTHERFLLKVYSFDIYTTPETSHKQKEWILRDANALHRLAGHPNIARAYIPFPWRDNQIVLPLEWIDGHSLRGLLATNTEIEFGRKIDILCQTCDGLNFAHNNGVIHRDIRPENIIVPYLQPVKLVNFDCSRVVDMETLRSRVGRHLDERYLAPEVVRDPSAASPASDLYTVGIIFFELLTGQLPYKKIQEVVAANGLPKLPTQIKSDLSPDVDEVVNRMCAFSPEDRYTNLIEVVEYLRIIE